MNELVQIVEVSPRDGLQNEAVALDPDERVKLIASLIEAGVTRLEAVSLADPRRVPSMAGAEEVMGAVPRDRDVSYIGLAMNRRGVERAVTARVDEINIVIPVTDSFAKANQNSTTGSLLAELPEMAAFAGNAGLPVSVTLAVAFGCPFEGRVASSRVLEIMRRVDDVSNVVEIALADTIGCGVPRNVFNLFRDIAKITNKPLRAHFHETRRTGLANTYAALRAGVRCFDSSAGGLGGCPFAPGAAGNLATEDLIWMLEQSGYRTGLDHEAIIGVGRSIADAVGHESRSALSVAGYFPVASSPRK